MKKQYFILSLVVAAMLSACSQDYLTQLPGGSSITEEQYQQMDNMLQGTVLGVYPTFYEYGGEHDVFGQRAIDMYTDLLCGDMALKTQNYGWFATDELMQTYTRRSYFWNYYYYTIRCCNKAFNAVDAVGAPSLDPAEIAKLDEDGLNSGLYYAELLTLRAWAYSGLVRAFSSPKYDENELAVPIYTDEDTKADTILGRPRSPLGDVYMRIEEDFTTAVAYFEAYNMVPRMSKLEVNGDVARILLAYSYLNKGDYANALLWAQRAIDNTSASLLPSDEVLTTGFNNVENNNWIWGQDVNVQTTTSLASFFGQCDIYSYSYAGAGDIKGIDANLYKEITDQHPWDKRAQWWNNYYDQKVASNYKMFQYAPDGKFYTSNSIKKVEGDRDWLSDNVYMRLELAYLIAAEAACRLGNLSEAQDHLFAITDQRVKDGMDAEYADWKSTKCADQALLLAEIRYNWRVELWGEGYALQTFRRFGETVTLGDNHLRSQKSISPVYPSPRYFTFELPNSELYYNPFIRDYDQSETKVRKPKN